MAGEDKGAGKKRETTNRRRTPARKTKIDPLVFLTDGRNSATRRQIYHGDMRAKIVFGGSTVATAFASLLAAGGHSFVAAITLTFMYGLVLSLDRYCQKLAQAWGEVVEVFHEAMLLCDGDKIGVSETPYKLMRVIYRKIEYRVDYYGKMLRIAVLALWAVFTFTFLELSSVVHPYLNFDWTKAVTHSDLDEIDSWDDVLNM